MQHQMALAEQQYRHLQTDQRYWCCQLLLDVPQAEVEFDDQSCFDRHCLVHMDYWLLIFFLRLICGKKKISNQ